MLGDKIRKERIKKGVSVAELSRTAGISTATIDKIEHSRLNDVRLSTVKKIADALNINISDIINE